MGLMEEARSMFPIDPMLPIPPIGLRSLPIPAISRHSGIGSGPLLGNLCPS